MPVVGMEKRKKVGALLDTLGQKNRSSEGILQMCMTK